MNMVLNNEMSQHEAFANSDAHCPPLRRGRDSVPEKSTGKPASVQNIALAFNNGPPETGTSLQG